MSWVAYELGIVDESSDQFWVRSPPIFHFDGFWGVKYLSLSLHYIPKVSTSNVGNKILLGTNVSLKDVGRSDLLRCPITK